MKTIDKKITEETWVESWYRNFGSNIVKVYEAAYKHWHPDYGARSNVGFEAGMDFQNAVKDFIAQQITTIFQEMEKEAKICFEDHYDDMADFEQRLAELKKRY